MSSIAKDLAGRQFGGWLAVRATTGRARDGAVIWECLCDCGETGFIRSSQLIGGEVAELRQKRMRPRLGRRP